MSTDFQAIHRNCNFDKTHIQENKHENVFTATHLSNGVDVISNGIDSNGMDISVFLMKITRTFQQIECCP